MAVGAKPVPLLWVIPACCVLGTFVALSLPASERSASPSRGVPAMAAETGAGPALAALWDAHVRVQDELGADPLSIHPGDADNAERLARTRVRPPAASAESPASLRPRRGSLLRPAACIDASQPPPPLTWVHYLTSLF